MCLLEVLYIASIDKLKKASIVILCTVRVGYLSFRYCQVWGREKYDRFGILEVVIIRVGGTFVHAAEFVYNSSCVDL